MYYREKRIHLADDFDDFAERYKYSFNEKREGAEASFKSNKISFGKKQTTMCFVKDDLTISPSLVSRILILNGAGIPLSDVEETEFHIGPKEVIFQLFLFP